MTLTRREILGGLASLAVLNAALDGAKAEEGAPALRRLGVEKGLVIGSAFSTNELNPADESFFRREVARITPENELKMTAIRPVRETFDFARADVIADFAARGGLEMRGHTLIWNNEKQPGWLATLSAAETRATIEEHIERTMGRYEGRIEVWDVINEPIGGVAFGPYMLRDGPFVQRLGPDYIALVFRTARAAAPRAKLVLNETHTERDDRFGRDYRKRLLYVIDRLQDAGVPLDGIGLQGHLQPDKPFDPDGFGAFLDEIARRKLFIEITELDVNDASFPDDIAQRDQAVAATYRRFLRTALANPAVRSLGFWQLGDAASWYVAESVEADPSSRRRPRPLLYDVDMRPKTAFDAVADELRRMPARPLR
ncbi:endo-1,4-beta-xylanase [Rhodomicrobium sp. Az07]|uniref:endo-1,4-beta-xylanase n=1 Tax=Rhodomicrobium sp. Az07 TaxID=2839034 RepID=UPI001BE7CBA1|nr:endo-1,4-beta-xylanase [Rhodomicrobium sp. Az07]MBT3069817.1 endo-1,4-beta-xylanase [Rhodomicrobium sp. Az07]